MGGRSNFLRDQPVLAGCLGCLGLFVLCAVGLVLLGGLGVRGCAGAFNQAVGVDSMLGTTRDAFEAGFSLSISVTDDGATFSMEPSMFREVTCDELKAILFPHLTGKFEVVVVESTTIAVQGELEKTIPLTCTWSGYPGAESAESL